MKLLYIAAPYKAKTIVNLQQNIHEASLMAKYYWHKGYAVICPHMNSANFDGLMKDEVFLQGYLLMLSKCDAIAMHPNWEQSQGCVAEHDFMKREKKKENLPISAFEIFKSSDIQIFYPEWNEILTILDVLYREG